MPNEPTACAIMLTCDRPELAKRAVQCFKSQTYPAKRLLVYDSGIKKFVNEDFEYDWTITKACERVGMADYWESRRVPIGTLRNEANLIAQADIFIHWDDDDWSHPNRIAEQVALLQSSGAEAVGYKQMLFWREPVRTEDVSPGQLLTVPEIIGEVWMFSGHTILGTSLCYWRKTWEKRNFKALPARNTPPGAVPQGEDTEWLMHVKAKGVSALNSGSPAVAFGRGGPAMIARIHGANTQKGSYDPAIMRAVEKQGGEWKRVPEWDDYCYGQMEFPLSNTAWYLPK